MKNIIKSLLIIILVFGCASVFAQTSNPATNKPNQNMPPTTTTDPAVDKTTSANPTSSTPTRTDSVVATPKEGTSITTAPGTPKKKNNSKTPAANTKKTKP